MKDRAACNLQPAQLPRPGGGRPASQDVPLEDVQYLAGHANPRTTQCTAPDFLDRLRPHHTQAAECNAGLSGHKIGRPFPWRHRWVTISKEQSNVSLSHYRIGSNRNSWRC